MQDTRGDFWWLPKSATISDFRVGFQHYEPDSDWDPTPPRNLHAIDELPRLAQQFSEENVFRSLKVFDSKGLALLGPFYLDIDAGSEDSPNLDETLLVARACVVLLRDAGTSDTDLRVLFSGCKGFNVEVRPETFFTKQHQDLGIREWEESHRQIVGALRKSQGVFNSNPLVVAAHGTQIDRVVKRVGSSSIFHVSHHFLRLTGSWNVWPKGRGRARKLEVPIDQLFTKTIEEIQLSADMQWRKDVRRESP